MNEEDQDQSSESFRALTILGEVLEVAPDQRSEYLDRVCDDEPELRRRVEELLAAEPETAFLERGAAELAVEEVASFVPEDSRGLGAGSRLGSYRLLEEIGAGGMSRVFLAERADGQFEQQVAVKVMRRFIGDAKEAKARFEVEQNLLARLAHPNIAQIFDGGVTEGGRPYLAMEHLSAQTIVEHCRDRRLGLMERLDLFGQVCEAVQHAHSHLVVHRDLKPSNVLVTNDGRVKLLDFGIAKLLDPQDFDEALEEPLTRTGLLLFTPEYAAPEQIRGEAVTTATDVYGLGLLLYEILTDTRPFDLSGKRASEIEAVVCETAPAKPSSRLTTSGREASESFSSGVDPRLLTGDLDTIAMMALNKEPALRYGSARELAEDLERYLQRLPVNARRPSAAYRARKFFERNRAGSLVAALVLFTVVSALVAVSLQQRETARQRDAAKVEAQKSRRLADFTLNLFEEANPESGAESTARDLLVAGVVRLDDMDDEPLVQIELLGVMRQALHRLGDLELSRELIERELALVDEHLGDSSQLGVAHFALAASMSLMGDDEGADQNYRAALSVLESIAPSEGSQETVWALRELGRHYVRSGRIDEGQETAQRGLTMARRLGLEREELSMLSLLSFILGRRGDFDRALELRLELRDSQIALLGEEHPDSASNEHNLGALRSQRGDFELAREHYEHALALKTRILPPGHSSLSVSRAALGHTLVKLGALDEGEELILQALEEFRASSGSRRRTVAPLVHLSEIARERDRPLDAESFLEQALSVLREEDGEYSPEAVGAWSGLAQVQASLGRSAEAEESYLACLKSVESLGEGSTRAVKPLLGLAELLGQTGREEEGRQLVDRAVAITREKLPEDAPRRQEAEAALAALETL